MSGSVWKLFYETRTSRLFLRQVDWNRRMSMYQITCWGNLPCRSLSSSQRSWRRFFDEYGYPYPCRVVISFILKGWTCMSLRKVVHLTILDLPKHSGTRYCWAFALYWLIRSGLEMKFMNQPIRRHAYLSHTVLSGSTPDESCVMVQLRAMKWRSLFPSWYTIDTW
jgi:hypothetical protein